MTLLPRFRAALLLLSLLAAGLVGLPARAALLAEALVASGLDTPSSPWLPGATRGSSSWSVPAGS
jgi:hypothetical protein